MTMLQSLQYMIRTMKGEDAATLQPEMIIRLKGAAKVGKELETLRWIYRSRPIKALIAEITETFTTGLIDIFLTGGLAQLSKEVAKRILDKIQREIIW